MIKAVFFITVALVLLIASAPKTSAAMCFQYKQSGGGISVAQADLPAANKCTPLALYEVGTDPAHTLLGAGTGSLCTSRSGTFVIYHYTYEGCLTLDGDNYFESGTCRLQLQGSLPTGFSVCRGTVIRGKPGQVGKVGNFYNTDDLVITTCDSETPTYQVPTGEVAECLTRRQTRRQLRSESSEQPGQLQSSDQPR